MNIDQDKLRNCTMESMSEIFEAMVFSMVSPVDYSLAEEPDEEKLFRTDILIETPFTGHVYLQVPETLATQITIDIFGWMEEKPPSETMIRDALSELVNAFVGRLMTKLIPENETFSLGLPENKDGWITPPSEAEAFGFELNDKHFSVIIEGDVTVRQG